jgi:orotate phosphoribosyltransferase
MSEIADRIKASGAIRRGEFELSSGATADYYIDKYVFETQPDVLERIADGIAARIDPEEVDIVAGPELGAVPLVTAVSLRTGIPSAYIRKDQKDYGTQARIEGDIGEGTRVAIVEDVTTTGNTIIETAELIEELGGIPKHLIVVVDRNEGGEENVREAGYELEYLVQVGEELEIEDV